MNTPPDAGSQPTLSPAQAELVRKIVQESIDEAVLAGESSERARVVAYLRDVARRWEHKGDLTSSGKSAGYYWMAGAADEIEKGRHHV